MATSFVLQSALLVVVTIMFLAFSCACKVTRVTTKEVDEWINTNIPVGSTKDEVIAFLDSSKVNSLQAKHNEFRPYAPEGTDVPDANPHLVYGYLVASIPNAGKDDTKLQVYNIRVVFYFGKEQNLIDHKTQMFGDW
jgi:hypothetical protein